MDLISARNLSKRYGRTPALAGVDLTVTEGRVVGLLGPNGAGKSTALQAILGLISHDGELSVVGRDPWTQRETVMEEVAFIADVAVLPRWLRVAQAVDYMEGVHPRFDRAKALALLERSAIRTGARVRELSKGMITQLHLSLVMAIDARLLVLDEPTLGLDLLYRKAFYDTLIGDYIDGERTILLSTHDIHDVEPLLTDVVFLDAGRVVLAAEMDELRERFLQVTVRPDRLSQARAKVHLSERTQFGRSTLLFDGQPPEALSAFGEVRRATLAEIFVGIMGRASEEAGK